VGILCRQCGLYVPCVFNTLNPSATGVASSAPRGSSQQWVRIMLTLSWPRFMLSSNVIGLMLALRPQVW